MGAKRDWRSGLAGGERGRGRPRERARLSNFQGGAALAAVRAQAAEGTSAWAWPMASAHVGRTPRDRASPEKKAFPFLLGLLSPPPRRPLSLHFRILSFAGPCIKPYFFSLVLKGRKKEFLAPRRLLTWFQMPGTSFCDCDADCEGPYLKPLRHRHM